MFKTVNVIGAGLAGCEASYQLAKRGIKVKLFEMKPKEFTPAHKSGFFAELVCSNSLKSNDITNACGLLKEELRLLDSLVIKAADKCKVPAGGALAVDREKFAEIITNEIKQNELIEVVEERVDEIDTSIPTIVATGPLTAENLANNLAKLLGQEYLYFFDAAAPIVTAESVDKEKSFIADRYDKGENGGDYLNCPMNKEEYMQFYNELITAETVKLKDFEGKKVFESCMPVEVLAKRGEKSLLFGPLKPVGLTDPKTDRWAYATVQLRKENLEANLYNMVGFQTNLTFKEQKRVFSLIPALKNAEFIKYGVMHKNTFINAPKSLNKFYQLKNNPNIFIAGQLSGVEGYVESISSGLMCGINMASMLSGESMLEFSNSTMIGALINYITTAEEKNFQPMNSNWGIVKPLEKNIRDKKLKRKLLSEIAIKEVKQKIN